MSKIKVFLNYLIGYKNVEYSEEETKNRKFAGYVIIGILVCATIMLVIFLY